MTCHHDMDIAGLNPKQAEEVWKIVGSILHLGDIQYEGQTTAEGEIGVVSTPESRVRPLGGNRPLRACGGAAENTTKPLALRLAPRLAPIADSAPGLLMPLPLPSSLLSSSSLDQRR